MNMAIIGVDGKMGHLLKSRFEDLFNIYGIDKNTDVKSISELNDLDIVIDFSSPSAYDEVLYAVNNKIPTLSGTTGYTLKQIATLKEIGGDLFCWSCNYAKGINYFNDIINLLKDEYTIESLVDVHDVNKRDTPSGTALMLMNMFSIDRDKVKSFRIKDKKASHILSLVNENERITIMHEVLNKNAFIDSIAVKVGELLNVKKAL